MLACVGEPLWLWGAPVVGMVQQGGFAMSDLKKCPVCGSSCFSDMDVCYGCLHRFGRSEAQLVVAPCSQSADEGVASCQDAYDGHSCLPEAQDAGTREAERASGDLMPCDVNACSRKEKSPSDNGDCRCDDARRCDSGFEQIEIIVRIPKSLSSLLRKSAA